MEMTFIEIRRLLLSIKGHQMSFLVSQYLSDNRRSVLNQVLFNLLKNLVVKGLQINALGLRWSKWLENFFAILDILLSWLLLVIPILLTWWEWRLWVKVKLFRTIKALYLAKIKSLRNLLHGFGMLGLKISRGFRAFLRRPCILLKNGRRYLFRRGIVSEKRSFFAWRSLYDSGSRTLLCFWVFAWNTL
jgi:hypothetical protein